jgi:hypothetical protein
MHAICSLWDVAGRFARISECREGLGRTIERLRNGALLRLPSRDQGFAAAILDRVQAFVQSGKGDALDVLGSVQTAQDAARRSLRSRPVQMLEVLHELEGFEEQLLEFLEPWERAGRLGDTA